MLRARFKLGLAFTVGRSDQSSHPVVCVLKGQRSCFTLITVYFFDEVVMSSPVPYKQASGSHLHSQRGQGMTEYLIIVALVAVAAIAVYQYFGQVLRAQTAAIAKELAGEDGSQETRTARAAAQGAKAEAKRKSLNDFTGNADKSSR